jgi:hypothetical protein
MPAWVEVYNLHQGLRSPPNLSAIGTPKQSRAEQPPPPLPRNLPPSHPKFCNSSTSNNVTSIGFCSQFRLWAQVLWVGAAPDSCHRSCCWHNVVAKTSNLNLGAFPNFSVAHFLQLIQQYLCQVEMMLFVLKLTTISYSSSQVFCRGGQ